MESEISILIIEDEALIAQNIKTTNKINLL